MFNLFKRESNDKNCIPYTRIASWLLESSTSAATSISEVLLQQNITSKNELADGWPALCADIGSFHASNILRMIMEARQVVGREHFVITYKELEKAISEVSRAFEYVSDVGQIARFWIDYQQREQNFNYTLHYFEGDQAKLGISPKDIDHYVEDYGSDSIRNLHPAEICILIRANRNTLIEKNTSAEKRSFGMEVVVHGVLRHEQFGFVGLTKAVFNLLQSGEGDKPVSKLDSKKLIRDDMASFLKAR